MADDLRARGIAMDRAEANAAARAKAIAINRNKNFIIFPGSGADGAIQSCMEDDGGDLGNLFDRTKDNDAEANAVAFGKAVICNKNINIVIYK